MPQHSKKIKRRYAEGKRYFVEATVNNRTTLVVQSNERKTGVSSALTQEYQPDNPLYRRNLLGTP